MPPPDTITALDPAPVDFQALFERSPGLHLVLDPKLRIVAASDAYCRATLVKRADMLGCDIFDVFPDNAAREGADGVANLRASLERVVRLRRSDAMAIQRYDVRADGDTLFEERYWAPMNMPLLSEGGELLYIIHRVHDVTDAVLHPENANSQARLVRSQGAVIRRLRDANAELAQLDSMRDGLLHMSRLNTIALMASALAHDVSQPLTAAKNYLGAYRRLTGAPQDGKANELLSRLAAQVDRASDIVKNLRRFISAGNTVHRLEDVAGVAAESAKLAESVVRAAGATLTVSIAPGLPAVMMDRVQIQQVLLNLLTNAADAVTALPVCEIALSVTQDAGTVRIAVADTGAGLPDDVAERLFEPFSTTGQLGLGLGLPICRQIVKQHNGDLLAAPNRPRGTVFSVVLPAEHIAAAASTTIRGRR
jgi:C4-dicarboxylate-specific signal transduction histidine kinase